MRREATTAWPPSKCSRRYWPVYFETLRRCLKPGRSATLQIITIADHRWDIYRSGVDFVQKYIFPGGMLPSPSILRREVEQAGLDFLRSIEFGESYSRTLRLWHDTFNARWDEVARLGFDDRFRRMWNFYLASCAAAFHGGNCDVTQVTLSRPA
jgi:cyclopropane-fatty-acyl-phospholipid synthase